MNEPKVQKNGERERRTKRRFQIEQEVRYKMLYGQRIAETGTGKTMTALANGPLDRAPSDLVLWARVCALVDAGTVEMNGDGSEMRSTEVRRRRARTIPAGTSRPTARSPAPTPFASAIANSRPGIS